MTDPHDLTHPAPWEQIDGLESDGDYGVLRLFLLVAIVPVLIVAPVFALVWWLR